LAKIYGILGFNMHLPISAEDSLFDKIYNEKLKPFFQTINLFPNFPFVLHLSGSLLYKIERMHGDFFWLIKDMIKRRQIELAGGGFYEPMMPFLHHQDRVGQIELMTTYIRKHFGIRVYGAYIPNVAFEQSVVADLAGIGIDYTFVHESRFVNSGFKNYPAPCITEDKGRVLIVFPVFESLAAKLETRSPDEAFDSTLKSVRGGKGHALFTIFPNFFSLYNNGKIPLEKVVSNFFETALKYEDKIKWTLPRAILKEKFSAEPLKKVYFVQDAPKKYLTEHYEADLIYSKMLYVRSLIAQLKGDRARKYNAQEELWKAQGYTLFCEDKDFENHLTGAREEYTGIQNTALRGRVYSSMIEAERIIRDAVPDWKAPLMSYDFDNDGIDEYLFQNKTMNCFVNKTGAVLFELDYFPKRWNYTNILKLGDYFPFSFFDVICRGDQKRVCGLENYKCLDMERVNQCAVFFLPRSDEALGSVEIEKKYKLKKNILHVHYKLQNASILKEEFVFSTYINLSFPSDFKLRVKKIGVENEGSAAETVKALDFEDIQNELIINIKSDTVFKANVEHLYSRYKRVDGEITPHYQFTKIKIEKPVALAAQAEGANSTLEFSFALGIFDSLAGTI